MNYNMVNIKQWKIVIDDPIFVGLINSKDIIDFVNDLIERKKLNENATISLVELEIFRTKVSNFLLINQYNQVPDEFYYIYLWMIQWLTYSKELKNLLAKYPSLFN